MNPLQAQTRIRTALFDRNMTGLSVAMLGYPDRDGVGELAALMMRDLPPELREWWLGECDKPHDESAVQQEVLGILQEHLKEKG